MVSHEKIQSENGVFVVSDSKKMAFISLNNVDVEFHVDADVPRTLKSTAFQFMRPKRRSPRSIHALKSLLLTVRDGERVGVIGPNGAGKSTLLKLIAGIYYPKAGDVEVEGHVCPLFEFATGFEMEATGWDNIRTRCLLLGMPPKEIEEKMGEIADFSGLEEFLDVPVRYYSSGMLLRLAFASSTAVEPEILLLDEVMGAGDAAFMDKAKKRMDGLMKRASIVIFVSHSLDLLSTFCGRTVWLHQGRKMGDGATQEIIKSYKDFVKVSQSLSSDNSPAEAHIRQED